MEPEGPSVSAQSLAHANMVQQDQIRMLKAKVGTLEMHLDKYKPLEALLEFMVGAGNFSASCVFSLLFLVLTFHKMTSACSAFSLPQTKLRSKSKKHQQSQTLGESGRQTKS